MIELEKINNLFIDFDGVIVDSNKFKELAIENSINKLFSRNKKNIEAIDYFNLNAGISRKKKLSLFFNDEEVSKIMESYSRECNRFFKTAVPTDGFKEFLQYIKINHSNIKIYILSGGEKNEIEFFLRQNKILKFFDDILSSDKSKIVHLQEKLATKNDIFIGDSKNDLNTSLKVGLKFILIEQYKSLKSFPDKYLVKEKVFLQTKNFESLINKINQ